MQVLRHWYYCRHWHSQKKKSLFNSSLQSGRNVVSQLTLTYSLIAVVSFETISFFRVSSFCTNCLRSLIISFQNTNCKWSGTRFFLHPGVKQNVPEWLVWYNHKDVLRWKLKSLDSWVPDSPFLFHWKLVLKLNVEFRILSLYFAIIVFKSIHFISFLPCINDFSIITPFTYWQINCKFGELLPWW